MTVYCNLKVTNPCNLCNGKHLQILCHVNQRHIQNLYLDHTSDRVLLKVVAVTLTNGDKTLDAILDDGSEKTIILQPAAQQLCFEGKLEILTLRTVCQDVKTLEGAAVSCPISSVCSHIKEKSFMSSFHS